MRPGWRFTRPSCGSCILQIWVLACIHQTPAGPPHSGDAYALMFAWADLTEPGQERGDAESTGSGSNHREDERSASLLGWPCRSQWRRIKCKTTISPYPQWMVTTCWIREKMNGPNQRKYEVNTAPDDTLDRKKWKVTCQKADPATVQVGN